MACQRTQNKRARIRDKQQCQICGDILSVAYGRLEVHHIVHCCKGGSDELENLVTLCDLCHAITHDHMGPAWVGLCKVPIDKQEQLKLTLNQAQEEFESYLRLPIEKRRRVQKEIWLQWEIMQNNNMVCLDIANNRQPYSSPQWIDARTMEPDEVAMQVKSIIMESEDERITAN